MYLLHSEPFKWTNCWHDSRYCGCYFCSFFFRILFFLHCIWNCFFLPFDSMWAILTIQKKHSFLRTHTHIYSDSSKCRFCTCYICVSCSLLFCFCSNKTILMKPTLMNRIFIFRMTSMDTQKNGPCGNEWCDLVIIVYLINTYTTAKWGAEAEKKERKYQLPIESKFHYKYSILAIDLFHCSSSNAPCWSRLLSSQIYSVCLNLLFCLLVCVCLCVLLIHFFFCQIEEREKNTTDSYLNDIHRIC